MPINVENFFLDPEYEGTLQQQIQQMVAEGILSGRFRAGEKLPSSRSLASHLSVSRITVTLAYTELLASDYIAARDRSGYFVSDTAPSAVGNPKKPVRNRDEVDWARAIRQPAVTARNIVKPADWSKYRYPFIFGQTDPTLFDHRNWRLCAMQALGQKDFEALTTDYFERDDERLIEFIARHVLPRRGIVAGPNEILLTMGAQNALWITAQLLLGARRTAVIENPCYPGLRQILEQSRSTVRSVNVDAGGLPPGDIPEDADVVFTTPSHQCPTAVTMPLERRREILALAISRNFLLVEDDYEFEMSFLKPPHPSLKSLDRNGNVIYVGSFSKSLFPGLRLGYLVASEPFIREARALRAAVLRHPPGHVQRTAAYFLSLGHFDALINRMRRSYRERRAEMERAIKDHGLEIAGGNRFGGSSFWMRAPESVDTEALAEDLKHKSVLIEPGAVFFNQSNPPSNFYRLAYSSIPTRRIAEGIDEVARSISKSGLR